MKREREVFGAKNGMEKMKRESRHTWEVVSALVARSGYQGRFGRSFCGLPLTQSYPPKTVASDTHFRREIKKEFE